MKLILDFNRVIEHMRLTTHEHTMLRDAGPDAGASRLHHLSFSVDIQCSGVARVVSSLTRNVKLKESSTYDTDLNRVWSQFRVDFYDTYPYRSLGRQWIQDLQDLANKIERQWRTFNLHITNGSEVNNSKLIS